MLELKELLEEKEALNQERAHKLKEEGLNEQKDGKLLKRKDRRLLELVKKAEYNPRYHEEYEQLLIRKDYQREDYRLTKFF